MRVPEGWIEHRRGRDREIVGWLAPRGDAFVPVDLLGRPVSEAVDWLDAEAALDAIGLAYLADAYELRLADGTWLPVRITQVSTDRITVKKEDGGAIDAPREDHALPFPVDDRLRPRTAS